MNSVDTEGSSDGSDGNTAGVRTLLTICNCSPTVYFSLKWFFYKIEPLNYDIFQSYYAQAYQTRRKRSREGTPTTGMTLFFTKCHILMNNRVVLGSQLYYVIITAHIISTSLLSRTLISWLISYHCFGGRENFQVFNFTFSSRIVVDSEEWLLPWFQTWIDIGVMSWHLLVKCLIHKICNISK